jgi:hypothetical protein
MTTGVGDPICLVRSNVEGCAVRTIETTATVTTDGKLIASAPPDIAPGDHRVVVVIDEQIIAPAERRPLKLHVWDLNAWPPDSRFRREELYEDDDQ